MVTIIRVVTMTQVVTIKYKNMKKISFIVVILLLIGNLNALVKAQSIDKKYYVFLRNAKTSDLLYLNDSIPYLMNRSPLEVFPKYKNLYDSYKEIIPVELKFEFGTQIPPFNHTTYQVMWYLKDSVLYLSDINFYSLSICTYKSVFPDNEQYELMEKLTKVKIDKTKRPLSSDPFRHTNTIGMIPSNWSNDTLLIKRARDSFEDIEKWLLSTPVEVLVFKNGKLISIKTTDTY